MMMREIWYFYVSICPLRITESPPAGITHLKHQACESKEHDVANRSIGDLVRVKKVKMHAVIYFRTQESQVGKTIAYPKLHAWSMSTFFATVRASEPVHLHLAVPHEQNSRWMKPCQKWALGPLKSKPYRATAKVRLHHHGSRA